MSLVVGGWFLVMDVSALGDRLTMNSDWVEVLDAKLTLRVKLCTMVEFVTLVL